MGNRTPVLDRPTGVGVAARPAFGRRLARRLDDGGVHQGAALDDHPGRFDLRQHGGKERLGKPGFQQTLAKAHEYGLVGNGVGQRKAEKAAEGQAVGALRFAFGVGQVVPLFEQQHLEADQGVVGAIAGGAVQSRPVMIERRPIHQPGCLHEKVAVGNVKFQRFVAKGFLRLDAAQHVRFPLRFVSQSVISGLRKFVSSYAEVSASY